MKYEHQLRKLSSEERKNLSSEELFHSAEFSSYLQKMGETLLRHCGITKRPVSYTHLTLPTIA